MLAGEGFLPGYGLYDGGISAFPGWRGGAVSFELSRPQAIAVREFVPGNMLYANRGRYRTARYHFPVAGEEQQTEAYLADLASGFVTHGRDAVLRLRRQLAGRAARACRSRTWTSRTSARSVTRRPTASRCR